MGKASDVILIVLGVYCIIRGIMILTTGRLARGEEAVVRDFSEKGVRRYKLMTAVMNIAGGAIVGGLKLADMTGLIGDKPYIIIFLAAVIVMIVCYVVIRNSCKKC